MLTPGFAFNHTVTIERWIKRGISADEYAAPETHRARVHFKTRRTGGKQLETTAAGTVWMDAGIRLNSHDKMTFDGVTYAIISCHPSYDIMGRENHVEVEIQ